MRLQSLDRCDHLRRIGDIQFGRAHSHGFESFRRQAQQLVAYLATRAGNQYAHVKSFCDVWDGA
ncbi:hypothetical protein D3C78_1587290 [compost metagenome]